MLPILVVLSAQILLLQLAPAILASPLQLDVPILFDSTLLNTTILPIVNTGVQKEYPCFNPKPDRLPTNYADCTMAAIEMHKATDTRLYTFGRGSHATYKLPKTFFKGTCVLTLDMVYDDQLDSLTFDVIRDTIFSLALRCATGPVFDRGGVAAVGPRNVLHVTIIGNVVQGIF